MSDILSAGEVRQYSDSWRRVRRVVTPRQREIGDVVVAMLRADRRVPTSTAVAGLLSAEGRRTTKYDVAQAVRRIGRSGLGLSARPGRPHDGEPKGAP